MLCAFGCRLECSQLRCCQNTETVLTGQTVVTSTLSAFARQTLILLTDSAAFSEVQR